MHELDRFRSSELLICLLCLNEFLSHDTVLHTYSDLRSKSRPQTTSQPHSQGLSSYRPLERARRGPSSLAPGGGKMRDPGNEVDYICYFLQDHL